MKKLLIGIGILVAAVLLLLAWESTSVRNLGIRRVQPVGVHVNLELSEPVVPGVQTTVRWQRPEGASNDDVIFEVRGTAESLFVGQARLSDGSAILLFPCTIGQSEVGLTMLDAGTSQVIASQLVSMLPAGPDCF